LSFAGAMSSPRGSIPSCPRYHSRCPACLGKALAHRLVDSLSGRIHLRTGNRHLNPQTGGFGEQMVVFTSAATQPHQKRLDDHLQAHGMAAARAGDHLNSALVIVASFSVSAARPRHIERGQSAVGSNFSRQGHDSGRLDDMVPHAGHHQVGASRLVLGVPWSLGALVGSILPDY